MQVSCGELQSNTSISAPRDTKQVRNLNYREKKKQKTQQAQNHNVADEILQVIAMVDSHPFVQEIVHTKQNVPSVICYTNEQLVDLKHFVTSKSGKLGIDRTFNLGHFYVTTFVYKNIRLIRKETKDHPLFLGPLFLHQTADYYTYRTFFNHISSKLDADINNIDIRIPEIMEFGTDDEKALTKALEHAFPNSTRILCTKHLRDNLKHYMTNKAAIPTTDRETITRLVFDSKGLVNADDTYDFEEIASQIQSTTSNTIFNTYFKSRIDKYVFRPNRDSKTTQLWTNNNAESINNVLKINCNWKPQTTTDLIEKLFAIVNLQFLDTRRAIHGAGNFFLTSTYSMYNIPESAWRLKTTEQKENLFKNFLKDSKRKPQNVKIQSADGKFSIYNKARKIMTKPGQRKRTVNERTQVKR